MGKKYTNIGGQALIEGVMMRGYKSIAISVRKPDGEIETKIEKTNPILRKAFFRLPLIRGVFALIDSMIIGIKAITYSAEIASPEDFEDDKLQIWLNDKFGEKGEKIFMGITVLFSLFLAVFMFGILPSFFVGFLKSFSFDTIYLSISEGLLKLLMFVGYIVLISRMKEIRRVFEYHGAEHKTIACYEAMKPLVPKNAAEHSRLHPRCGTSFLFYVMAISIVLFSFVTWSSIWVRVALKLLLLPLVSGAAYEVIKLSGKFPENSFFKSLSWPGLMLQKLTTREPDEDQLEVAIAAMNAVLDYEGLQDFSSETTITAEKA